MTADEFARQLAGYLHVPIELKDDKDLMDADARTGNALIDFVRLYDTSKIDRHDYISALALENHTRLARSKR